MDIFDMLISVKKALKLNNEELGSLIGKNGDTFRKALNRKSLSDGEILTLAKFLNNLNLKGNKSERLLTYDFLNAIEKKIRINKTNILDKILSKEEESRLVKAIKYDPAYKELFIKEPDAIWVSYESYKLVPLVTQRAQAGLLNNWDDPEYINDLPKVPWEVDKEYKGKYLTFEVSGDSMESDDYPRESIYEGDLLLCREVMRHHWTNKLHINKWDFVIVHRDDGILVKRIIKHDTRNGELTLHSLNTYYDDQIVKMDDLLGIFNIVDVKRKRKRR